MCSSDSTFALLKSIDGTAPFSLFCNLVPSTIGGKLVARIDRLPFPEIPAMQSLTLVLLLACSSACLQAAELIVSTSAQLRNALQTAGTGDTILLQPGTYTGGLYRENLTGVTMRSVNPENRAIISGGNTNLQLSDAQDVTIEDLIFEDGVFNGLNLDDGGTFATPATNITIRNIVVRRAGNTGNEDGIKLSGVTGFTIDGVEVDDWGDGGSAIDMVGSHNGLIQNSWLHTSGGSSGIRPKGGSKNITIRANRIEMPIGKGRAIQAGGSTGSQYFRFIDGDSGYEANNILAEGNVVLGGNSAFSWVNIDGGRYHHNYVHRPGTWTMRILNENQGTGIIDTRNGQFHDNIVFYHDSPSEYNRAVNIGSETEPDTYQFARNQWYNEVMPSESTPDLPTSEIDGVYGVDPGVDPDQAISWTFAWGIWIVNATAEASTVLVDSPGDFLLASPGKTGVYHPSQATPFHGQWAFAPLTNGQVTLPAFSQIILARCDLPGICLSADFSADGLVNEDDLLLWKAGLGTAASASHPEGDADNDEDVDGNDFLQWQREIAPDSSTTSQAMAVPEPTTYPWAFLLLLSSLSRSFR